MALGLGIPVVYNGEVVTTGEAASQVNATIASEMAAAVFREFQRTLSA